MITTGLLADHLEAVPTLVRWFRAQWPDYFAAQTDDRMTLNFLAEANRQGLPLRLVALEDGALAGTIVLREHAVQPLPDYRPVLGGLFVAESYRRRGVGTALVRAGMAVAHDEGYETMYAGTVTARGLLERLGWEVVAAAPEVEAGLVVCRVHT